MNEELLQRAKAAILAEPRRFDMDTFVRGEGECGTTCCIFGHAIRLDDPAWFRNALAAERRGEEVDWWEKGRTVLKLGPVQSDLLCSVDNWPYDFQEQYKESETLRERAEVAAERIEHFIRVKGKR